MQEEEAFIMFNPFTRFQRNDSVFADFPPSICQHEHFLEHKIFMAGVMTNLDSEGKTERFMLIKHTEHTTKE